MSYSCLGDSGDGTPSKSDGKFNLVGDKAAEKTNNEKEAMTPRKASWLFSSKKVC